MNTDIDVTVAIVPREKFSYCTLSLHSLLANTCMPFKLVYFDGNSPADTRDWLRYTLSNRPDTQLRRFDHYLGPVQAMNMAIEAATTKYVVIADNDMYFRPGWLEALYRCAEEEEADVVSPLILFGTPDTDVIHVAGGDVTVQTAPDGKRIFRRTQRWEGRTLSEMAATLKREPTQLLENHCTLVRTAAAQALPPFDEREGVITQGHEWTWAFQNAGAKMLFEPDSRVVYMWDTALPLKWSDLPYWNIVFSERWVRDQLRVAGTKYRIDEGLATNRTIVWWQGYHRRLPILRQMAALRRLFERCKLGPVGHLAEKGIETLEVLFNHLFVAWLVRRKTTRHIGWPRQSVRPTPARIYTGPESGAPRHIETEKPLYAGRSEQS